MCSMQKFIFLWLCILIFDSNSAAVENKMLTSGEKMARTSLLVEDISADIKLAKLINTWRIKQQKGLLPAKENNEILKKIGRSFAFKNFLQVFIDSERVLNAKTYGEWRRECAIKNDLHKENTFKELYTGLTEGCRNLFFKKYIYSKGLDLTKKDLFLFDYITKELPLYLEGKNIIKEKKLYEIVKENESYKKFFFQNQDDKRVLEDRHGVLLEQLIDSNSEDEFVLLIEMATKAIKKKERTLAKVYSDNIIEFYKKNLTNREYIDFWESFILLGRLYERNGFLKEALKLFSFAKSISDGQKKEDALFLELWSLVSGRDIVAAKKFIEKEKIVEKKDAIDSKTKFWIGYVYLECKDIKKAKEMFQDILSNDPLGYYGILSIRYLVQLNQSIPETINWYFVENKNHINDKFIFSLKFEQQKKRIVAYEQSRSSLMLSRELKDFVDSLEDVDSLISCSNKSEKKIVNKREALLREILSVLEKDINRSLYFQLAQQVVAKYNLSPRGNILNFLFPLELSSLIQKYNMDIDSHLVLGLIRQESNFNDKAISRVGARGLMQLMPTTAKFLDKKVRVSDLYNPDVNLRLGIKYLKRLLLKYDGNIVFALAAYNAGENRMNRWMIDFFATENPLMMIESIPFKETRDYVKLIYRNMFFYKLLNKELNLYTPFIETFRVSVKR